jgi:hypothetical protein
MTATLRPEYLAPVTLNTTYALSLNNQPNTPNYGYSNTHTPDRQIVCTQVPGGFWAVKIRPRGDGWAAFAVPRNGTVGEPFDIATGTTRESVLVAGIHWCDSATVSAIRLDRIVFAGTGDATNETPLDTTEAAQ